MDRKNAFLAICQSIENTRGKLNDEQKNYIWGELMEGVIYNGIHIKAMIETFIEHINEVEAYKVDMNEYMMNEVSADDLKTSTLSSDVSNIKNYINIDGILGTRDPVKIQRIFNPSALVGRAYLYLDRRYHANNVDEQKFTWNITSQGERGDLKTSSWTMVKLKNIIGAKLYSFRFPATTNAINFNKRISISIDEFDMHGYTASNRRRFQFMMKIEHTGNDNDPYEIVDTNSHITTFYFYKPRNYLDTITLSFGNPDEMLTLNPDRLVGVISATGIQTLITFSQPHTLNLGDIVVLENVESTNSDDYVELDLLNNKFGWEITSLTLSTITIDVDISGVSGVLSTNNPIYFDSKRFRIPMEIFYIKE